MSPASHGGRAGRAGGSRIYLVPARPLGAARRRAGRTGVSPPVPRRGTPSDLRRSAPGSAPLRASLPPACRGWPRPRGLRAGTAPAPSAARAGGRRRPRYGKELPGGLRGRPAADSGREAEVILPTRGRFSQPRGIVCHYKLHIAVSICFIKPFKGLGSHFIYTACWMALGPSSEPLTEEAGSEMQKCPECPAGCSPPGARPGCAHAGDRLQAGVHMRDGACTHARECVPACV